MSSLLLHISFPYISSYTNHQDLHSFPTLRSSDLADRLRRETNDATLQNVAPFKVFDNLYYVGVGYVGSWLRSEEHTSEIQSLRHLVCRLLLEKKKNSYKESIMISKQRSLQ